jgi:hypothetical protein
MHEVTHIYMTAHFPGLVEAFIIKGGGVKLMIWFSPGTVVSSTNKTDQHDIAKILLKVALKAITLSL